MNREFLFKAGVRPVECEIRLKELIRSRVRFELTTEIPLINEAAMKGASVDVEVPHNFVGYLIKRHLVTRPVDFDFCR